MGSLVFKLLALTAAMWTANALAVERTPEDIFHGGHFAMDGQAYRYHQIYNGVWRGIPIDEWDDSVHVKNDTALDFSSLDWSLEKSESSQDIGEYSRDLEDRDLSNICQYSVTCAQTVANGAATGLRVTAQAIVHAVTVANQNRGSVWRFLESPFFVALSITVASVPTWISALTKQDSSKVGVATCSQQHSEEDVFVSALAKAIAATGNPNFLEYTITVPAGGVYKLEVASTPARMQGQCGAPST